MEEKKEKIQKKKSFWDRYNDLPKPLQKGKYLFISLAVICPIITMIVFYVGLNITGFLIAFQRTTFKNGQEVTYFTLENFKSVFQRLQSGDSDLTIAIRNTVSLFCVDLFMMIPIFLIALAFSQNMRGAKVFRIIIYLPSIISSIAFVTMIRGILQENVGSMAMLFDKFGWEFPNLFHDSKIAFKAVIGYCMWAGLYVNFLLFEGALRRIPQEILDAASIDGVNRFQEIVRIRFPLIWGTFSIILTMKVANFFMITGPILELTGGGYNTQTLNFWFFSMTMYGDANSQNVSAAGSIIVSTLALPLFYGFKWLMGKVSPEVDY